MKRTSFTVAVLAGLSGCVTQDEQAGGFSLKPITAECHGIAYGGEYVLRPTPKGPVVFAVGKCRVTDGGDNFRVLRTEAIMPFGSFARVRISDKLGRREILVRRSNNLYHRGKFTFQGRWIEKAPQS